MLKKITFGLSVMLPAHICGAVTQADELRVLALQSPQLVLNEVGAGVPAQNGAQNRPGRFD
jgi:hypothetical protein